MRKIFFMLTFILTFMTATAFAEESYEYTSQVYGFKIVCPSKPVVILNPFEDPKKRGELLVFANDGMKIIFGYQIMLDAFEDTRVPNFNKDKKKLIDAYIERLRSDNIYEFVGLGTVSMYDGKENKGVIAVTAKEIEVKDENGEVEGVLTADEKTAFTFFRTISGRCISIQLIASDFTEENFNDYRKSVSTYKDATDLALIQYNSKDKKSKKKKKVKE